MRYYLPACLFVLTVLLGGPRPAVAQSGFTLAGTWSWGHEASGFRPCNSDAEFWLWFTDSEAQTAYLELAEEPYATLFVQIAAWFDTGPRGEFAKEYDGTLRATRLDSIRALRPNECEGVEPPIWEGDVDELCEGATTLAMVQCSAAQLARVDRELQTYSEEALRFAGTELGQMDSFMLADRAWTTYRDVQCSSVYETYRDGSWRSLQHLGCRIGLARDRMVFLWNTYLVGSTTVLPEPDRR